jgi:hypothetical protein
VEISQQEYIDRLKLTIEHLHNCSAVHVYSHYVKEEFRGQTAWQGHVEVFHLKGHPKAERCFGWSHGEPGRFITILELPPVDSPESAVKVGLADEIKRKKV